MTELELARQEIETVDAEMAGLFERRMAACAKVAACKKETGRPIRDSAREQALLAKNLMLLQNSALAPYYTDFLKKEIDLSCRYQARLLERDDTLVLHPGALEKIGKLLNLDRKVLIVTDDGVPAGYAETVCRACREAIPVILPAGEASKSPENFRLLLKAMLNADLTRYDCVVAVGGGVVGDLSGFAAACYMRGIDFYNVPTTLLSQVDSSIGGKTAIDLDGVKNCVGAFYPPKATVIDPLLLQTLDARQLHAGLAEIIKIAAVCDAELFQTLEKCTDLQAALPELIRRAVQLKRDIVERDPKEQGLRKVLNFGHTLGHAIESAEGGRLLHGECVALGMLPMCAPEVRGRLSALLERWQLPTKTALPDERLLPYLLHDKKSEDTVITAVRVDALGSFRFCSMTPKEILREMEVLR